MKAVSWWGSFLTRVTHPCCHLTKTNFDAVCFKCLKNHIWIGVQQQRHLINFPCTHTTRISLLHLVRSGIFPCLLLCCNPKLRMKVSHYQQVKKFLAKQKKYATGNPRNCTRLKAMKTNFLKYPRDNKASSCKWHCVHWLRYMTHLRGPNFLPHKELGDNYKCVLQQCSASV